MTAKEFEMQYALGSLSYEQLYKIAHNPNTSKKVLKILSTDEDWYVRWRVAENPNTPKEILIKLSKDKNEDVRWRVAHSPNTPKEVLKILSTDKD